MSTIIDTIACFVKKLLREKARHLFEVTGLRYLFNSAQDRNPSVGFLHHLIDQFGGGQPRRFQNTGHHDRFRNCSLHMDLFVDHRTRYAHDMVFLSQMRELGRFHHLSPDVLVLYRQLVGQTDRTWAIGSGRSDVNLNVNRCLDLSNRLLGLFG